MKEYRILILESVPSDADAIEVQLHKASLACTIRRVATKELFLRAMSDFHPDLIIANAILPRFDVLAALSQSTVDSPDIPWVIVSNAANEDLAVSCMRAGASDYVNKKNLPRLGNAVKLVLEKKENKAKPRPVQAASPEAPKTPAPEVGGEQLAAVFRSVVEHSTDLIAIVNVEGKRIYNNPAYSKVLEDPESLQGTDSFIDVHPDDREMVKKVFHESLRTGVGKRIEYRLLDMKGDFRFMESQGNVLKDRVGKIIGLAVVSRDISDRKLFDASVQNLLGVAASSTAEELFPSLAKHLAEALGVRYALVSETVSPARDRVRSIAYWSNGQWAPPFEYNVAQTTCEKVLLEGTMCYYPDHVQELFPRESALVAMKAVSYLGLPLIGSDGHPLGHIFVMDDKPLVDFQRTKSFLTISAALAAKELERKRTLDDLRASETALRSILNSLNDGVVVTSIGDTITYVNPRIMELTGYTLVEMIGTKWATLMLPEEEWESLLERNKERQQGVTERYLATLKRKDGSLFTAAISAGPCRSQQGDIVGTLGIIAPIADRAS
jgi:PAS domain S-box-containing protein